MGKTAYVSGNETDSESSHVWPLGESISVEPGFHHPLKAGTGVQLLLLFHDLSVKLAPCLGSTSVQASAPGLWACALSTGLGCLVFPY